MIEQERGKPPTAASDWLVEFLNLDFRSSEPREAEKIDAFLSHTIPPPNHKAAHNVQIEMEGLFSESELKGRLLEVADALNEWGSSGAVKPQWQPETRTKKKARNLEPGQGVYKIGRERITFRPWRMIEHGLMGSAFIALAYLLESGKLDRLRKCCMCARFFFARDSRKEVCRKECRREKDRKAAVIRMTRRRRREKRELRAYALALLDKFPKLHDFTKIRKVLTEESEGALDEMLTRLADGVSKEIIWARASTRRKAIFRKLRSAGIT